MQVCPSFVWPLRRRWGRAGLARCGPGHSEGSIPEEVGFLSTRLKRLSDRLNEGVKNNELPGAVVLIARNGKIVMFESYGFRDKEAKVAMTNDTIFRIASMTKPIVTLAAMMLMEEGKLTLADRVSTYIPPSRTPRSRCRRRRTTARSRWCSSRSTGR